MNFGTISPSEWRWVVVITSLLVALTLLPLAWALNASDGQYTFMGVLSNPQDGATYLSKINQGMEGNWLFELRHTPQPHEPAAFHLFYLALGYVARFLGVSNIVIFHVARLVTSFFMFISLYQFGATVWMRVRPRRLFFLLTALGSGLGWLALLLLSEFTDDFPPDIVVPEAFPLAAAFTNPHFPLAIGCIALIGAQLLTAFRPGYRQHPTADNGGLVLLLLSLALTVVSPPGSIVLSSTLIIFLLVRIYQIRNIPYHELRWVSMVVMPTLPIGLYYLAVFRFNPVFDAFNQQNITPSPNPIFFIFSYGLLLAVALPGITRAIRRFEPDGDQFMLCWLMVNTLAVYLPYALNRRLFIGLLIPLVYFAVRSVEDYWLKRLSVRYHQVALLLFFILVVPSHLLTIMAPLTLAVQLRDEGARSFLLLENDYLDMLNWLEVEGQPNDVVLASRNLSLWIPARTGFRVVYGHPFETVPAERNAQLMEKFYRGEDCEAVFADELPFQVQYVVWGPQEDREGLVGEDDAPVDRAEQPAPENPEGGEDAPSTDSALLEDETRLPNADRCKEVLEALASEVRQFGQVSLFMLDDERGEAAEDEAP